MHIHMHIQGYDISRHIKSYHTSSHIYLLLNELDQSSFVLNEYKRRQTTKNVTKQYIAIVCIIWSEWHYFSVILPVYKLVYSKWILATTTPCAKMYTILNLMFYMTQVCW